METVQTPTTEYLQKLHAEFCEADQLRDALSETLASAGHPFAPQYRQLRAFFETLSCASDYQARLYSFGSLREFSEYLGPRLFVAEHPQGEALGHFGFVSPLHAEFPTYLDCILANGWPMESIPGIEGGSWLVHTQSEALRDALLELRSNLTQPGRIYVQTYSVEGARTFRVDISLRDELTPSLNAAIVSIIAKHHEGLILSAAPSRFLAA